MSASTNSKRHRNVVDSLKTVRETETSTIKARVGFPAGQRDSMIPTGTYPEDDENVRARTVVV